MCIRDRYELVRFDKCPVPRIWNILNRHGLRSVVVNVPIVFPVEPINGAMIAGMFAPTNEFNEKTVFPSDIAVLLERVNYVIDIEASELKHKSTREAYDVMARIVQARTEAFKLLMEHFNANLGVLVYTETDRVQHVFWYDRELVLRTYELIDEQLDELSNYFDSPMIIMSDHGFRGVKKGVIGNLLLHELGYLKFKDNYYKALLRGILRKLKGHSPTIEYEVVDWDKTIAYFRRDTWGFIINLAGRQPNGIVSQEEYEKTLNKLTAVLGSTDLFKYLYKNSNLYRGSYVSRAPDIIAIPQQNIKLLNFNEAVQLIRPSKMFERIKVMKDIIENKDPVIAFDKEIGEHSLEGIVGVCGSSFIKQPRIYDIAPSILSFFGIKVPNYMDGEPILNIDED